MCVLASSGHVSFTLTDSLASDMSLKMCLVDPLEKAQERLAAAYIFRKEYQMRTPVSGLVDSRSTQSTQLIVHVECVFPEQTPVVLRSEASVYRSRDGVYGVECVSGQLSAPAPAPPSTLQGAGVHSQALTITTLLLTANQICEPGVFGA